MDKDVLENIEIFFSRFKLRYIIEGKTLISAQVPPQGIFYIKRGFVKQYAISKQGMELTVHIFGPGSFFPMGWGLNEIPNRHYFQAVTDVEIYLAPKKKVIEFFTSESQVSFEFSKKLLSGLDGLTKRIESISFGKAYERVVSVLVYLSYRFGVKKGKNMVINYRFTHSDIASLVGVTREHVSLEMEKLEKQKLIIYKNHSIIILNISRLKSEISF